MSGLHESLPVLPAIFLSVKVFRQCISAAIREERTTRQGFSARRKYARSHHGGGRRHAILAAQPAKTPQAILDARRRTHPLAAGARTRRRVGGGRPYVDRHVGAARR